jgi:DNA-binding PadR family transcriptional regulator
MRHHWHDRSHDGRSHHGHGHHGWGRHGGREGSRSRRMFDHGDLRLVILALLGDAPRHGYELIKALEEMTGGAYSPSPGVIYPTLTLLEEQGLASAEADGSKKLYTLTEAGRAALEAERPMVDSLRQRMAETMADRSTYAPRFVRAMENLKTAIRLKLAQGGLDEKTIEAVADAIDEAAKAVERA